MAHLPVPKILKWSYGLDQKYKTNQQILVTSGCSFTASTQQIEAAASWPGYLVDRCRFDYCIDWGYPGSGNDYIGDSIIQFFKQVEDIDIPKYFVVIMWSGIDRIENKIPNVSYQPNINGIGYQRTSPKSKEEESHQAYQSYTQILKVYKYLTERNILFAFTYYCNLLFPPYIPKRDTTKTFDAWLDSTQLKELRNLDWLPGDSLDYLYEYAFTHDYLTDGDGFHPPVQCNLEWTDNILLPELAKRNLISEL